MKPLISCLCLLLISGCSFYGLPDIREFKPVDIKEPIKANLVKELLRLNKVQGVSISYFNKNGIIWAQGYGKAKRAKKVPVDTTTLFQAASISKCVSAFGILTLVDDSLIHLDEDIHSYLTDWQFDNPYPASPITLRGLLTHSGGINDGSFKGYRKKARKIPTLDQIRHGERPANSDQFEVIYEPGTSSEYSGAGFLIAQKITEDVSQMDFDEFMQQSVFDPLQMANSSYTYPKHDNVSDGFLPLRLRVKGGWRLYPEKSAAGLWSTPNDIARYMIEVVNAMEGQSNKVLSIETSQMHVQQGLGISYMEEERMMGFTGWNKGFVCQMVYSFKEDKGIVIMTNSDHGGPLISRIYQLLANQH